MVFFRMLQKIIDVYLWLCMTPTFVKCKCIRCGAMDGNYRQSCVECCPLCTELSTCSSYDKTTSKQTRSEITNSTTMAYNNKQSYNSGVYIPSHWSASSIQRLYWQPLFISASPFACCSHLICGMDYNHCVIILLTRILDVPLSESAC